MSVSNLSQWSGSNLSAYLGEAVALVCAVKGLGLARVAFLILGWRGVRA